MLDLENWQEKKYKTAGGKKIRLLCIDAPGEWPIKGIDDDGWMMQWERNGRNALYLGNCSYNLVNATPEPVTITQWVNVYKATNHYHCSMHDGEKQARRCGVIAGDEVEIEAIAIPVTITFTPKG